MELTNNGKPECRKMVDGVGPDAEVVVDPNTGAKQSAVRHRCDLLPPLATLHVASILHSGSFKYGDWNWFKIPFHEHLNHALIHILAHQAGDFSDDHIGHAACRMMMALERCLADRKMAIDRVFLTPYQQPVVDERPF